MFIACARRDGRTPLGVECPSTRERHFTPKGVKYLCRHDDYKHVTTTWLLVRQSFILKGNCPDGLPEERERVGRLGPPTRLPHTLRTDTATQTALRVRLWFRPTEPVSR
jgi:hypothetical protein